MIIGSTYAMYQSYNDYSYRSIGAYGDETQKPIEGHRAFVAGSLSLASSKTPSNNTYSDTGLLSGNQSVVIKFEPHLFNGNSYTPCGTDFTCKLNFTTGWKDKTSLQVSTNSTKAKASNIVVQEADVEPKTRYQLTAHMKLNQWATQSRVVLEGFNESSARWYRIDQCPSASVNGPQDWQEITCGITIDENTTKVRPILEAGWSSQPNKQSTTLFDTLYLIEFKPILTDRNLKAQVVYQGLDKPISMAFLGQNDFLVSGNKGTIHRIVNGVEIHKQMLDLNLAGDGILGIAVMRKNEINQSTVNGSTFVFVHFNANKDEKNSNTEHGGSIINRVYRYELVNNLLINPKVVLEFPCDYNHNGGPMLIGPDKQAVYFAGGDCENIKFQVVPNKALNNKTGLDPDGTGGILRFTEDGKPVGEGVLGSRYPTNLYYAYGIRQTFGMDFDPITGKLWNTENGANWGDEINLVEPGFNGGWSKVQGVWKDHDSDNDGPYSTNVTYNPPGLYDFDARGKYHSPAFVWKYTVGPTALVFLTSEKLGKEYVNDMFVGDVNNGRIYHFNLNPNRTELVLIGPLKDKIADSDKELENVVFAENFGIITDLKVGPDGYLYFVVHDEGKIYKIVPKTFGN